jgi:hypothetical protein
MSKIVYVGVAKHFAEKMSAAPFQHDTMPKASKPNQSSFFGRMVIALSWVGVAACAVAAINLALGRPWF